jgi:hypothetical protein
MTQGHRALRWVIILFCVFHMAAVAIYCIPDESKDHVSRFIAQHGTPLVRPYLLITSQWQKWNIFSPDPIRRVSVYRIEMDRNGVWIPALRIDPFSIPWWKHAKTLKLLNNIQDNPDSGGEVLLSFLCRTNIVPGGALVRFTADISVIPSPAELKEMGGWNHFMPTFKPSPIATFVCPRTS